MEDETARGENARLDMNGEKCAVVKVITTGKGFDIKGDALGLMGQIEKEGEIWLYVPHGARLLTLNHEIYGVLRNYEYPDKIEAGMVYKMILSIKKTDNINEGYGKISISSAPTGADIIINGERKGTTPQVLERVAPGKYQIELSKEGYVSVTECREVNKNELITVQVTLDNGTNAFLTYAIQLYEAEKYEEAFKLFQKLASQGSAVAYYWMGKYYEQGIGSIVKNIVKAQECYENANGYEPAKKALASLPLEQNIDLAGLVSLRQVFEGENFKGKLSDFIIIGDFAYCMSIYYNSWSVKGRWQVVDEAQSRFLGRTVHKYIHVRDYESESIEGFYSYDFKNHKWEEKNLPPDNSRSVEVTGRTKTLKRYTFKQWGDFIDMGSYYYDPEVNKWFKSQGGMKEALRNRAYLLYNAGNIERGVYWMRRAAEQGDPAAIYNMGNFYEKGISVSVDYNEALVWYKKAAENKSYEKDAKDKVKVLTKILRKK